MFGFLRPVRGRVVLAGVFLTAWIGAEIFTVRQTAEAINQIKRIHFSDEATREGFRAWAAGRDCEAVVLRRTLLVLAGLTVVLAVLAYAREVSNAKLSMHLVFGLREAIYDKLQRVGLGFHDAISTGELINRALSDLQNVRSFVTSALLQTLEITLIVGGYIVLLATRSIWIALLAILPMPLWTWYVMRFSRRMRPAQKDVMEASDRNVELITENIAGVHVVRAFATEQQEIDKYNRNSDSFLGRVRARIRLFANFNPVIRTIAMASHLTLFLAAGILIIKGRLQAGDILMLGAAMGAILTRLQHVAAINDQYQNAMVSSRRLHEVLQASPTVPEQLDAQPLPPGRGAVRFESVTFGYAPGRPVLHDVNFEVKGGSVVAIVGPTGAGKSTLVSLIARLYDPQSGRVLIDGVDVRDVALGNLRTQVALVFQETYLFSDTVEANIGYGRPSTRGGHIEAASRLAQAHEFVDLLPRGYDTLLGERGATLSGGQRQRLAIARAIAADPRILILDDATASVDPETEDRIQRGMRFVMKDSTVFVIAHRVSTVKRAEVVIVLEAGRVTQIGTHAELMARDGHYRDIAAVQLCGDAVDRDAEGDVLSHMDRVADPSRVAADTAAAREELDTP